MVMFILDKQYHFYNGPSTVKQIRLILLHYFLLLMHPSVVRCYTCPSFPLYIPISSPFIIPSYSPFLSLLFSFSSLLSSFLLPLRLQIPSFFLSPQYFPLIFSVLQHFIPFCVPSPPSVFWYLTHFFGYSFP